MTDFRNFRPGHDLRSELGLRPAIDVLNEAERFHGAPVDPATLKPYATGGFARRLDDALRTNTKPQDPATAEPNKLANEVHVVVIGDQIADPALDAKLKEIVSAGCTTAVQARRIGRHYDGLGINVGPTEHEAKVVWDSAAEARLRTWCKGMGLDFDKCDPKDMMSVYHGLQLMDRGWPINAPEPGKTIQMVTNYNPNYAGKVSGLDNEVADLMVNLIADGARTDLIHAAREKFNEAFSLLTESLKGQ